MGFPDELGYSHILYPAEKSARQLLLWLAAAMPHGDDEAVAGAYSSVHRAQNPPF